MTYRQSEFIAALPALYGPQLATFPTAAPELTKMIRPPFALSFNAGSAAWMVYTKEKKLMSKCDRHCATDVDGAPMGPTGSRTPAFRMSPSM